ncbi:hypothetical protein KHP62_16215 [Rhodobacteraceae bacterium NNCM2]|nr:hypothetical protein [Coraliihabitans acroporae]
MLARSKLTDLVGALAVTIAGGVLAWVLAGSLPLIGIDDAAITRSYAENIANGYGYVYNIGGERVEGATALLWALILALAYSLDPSPELLIIGICWLLTFWAVFSTFRLTRLLAAAIGASAAYAFWTLAILFVAMPGYFLWSVWTMMELALWSGMLIQLVLGLVTFALKVEEDRGSLVAVIGPAALLPMIRPEGVAVSIGLVALAGILSSKCRRLALVAIAAALAVFGAITAFRIAYFGVPWPNTFYAKVSSDAVQGLKDGLKYLADFVLGAPFAELFVTLWVGAAIWGLMQLPRDPAKAISVLVPAAAVFGILLTYAGLGGDHFVLWRFYQPVTPLLAVSGALVVALTAPTLERWSWFKLLPRVLLGAGMSGALIGLNWLHYYQARFDVVKEFALVEKGLAFGETLDTIQPTPVLGVGPAGGIALSYDGTIRDLLGLNWAEMARANPIKVGMRNHASFDSEVFWKHRPDVVAEFQRDCEGVWSTLGKAMSGLYRQPRFHEEYEPITIREDTSCWPAFAKRDWLTSVQDPRVDVIGWDQVHFPE